MYNPLGTLSIQTDIDPGIKGGFDRIKQADKRDSDIIPAGPVKSSLQPNSGITCHRLDKRMIGFLIDYIDKMASCRSPPAKTKYIKHYPVNAPHLK
ncbi:hypothetical protein D3C76_664050 [compost metagenome]